MKRFITALLLVFLLALAAAAAADQTPIIADEADLLTTEEESQLYEAMLPLCEYGTPILWTTRQSGDYDRNAKDFYYSRIGNGSGMMLSINMYARQLTVVCNGGIEKIITRAECETITDNIYRAAGRGDYLSASSSAFGQMNRLLRGEKIARPMKLVSNILLAASLALLLGYLYINRRYENHPGTGGVKTAVPLTVLHAASGAAVVHMAKKVLTKRRVTDLSSDSGGGGSHGGGGGFSGGGGGFSGGSSGSHGF